MNSILVKYFTNLMDHFGLKVISKWRWNSYELATHTRELFNLLGIDCVIDVGANIGQYGKFLRTHIGYKGLILSFEPVPEIYARLVSIAKNDPLWKTFPFALGSINEIQSINITKGESLHSFLTPKVSGLKIGNQGFLHDVDSFNQIIRSEMVEIKKLDSFIEEADSALNLKKSRIFLKLDTQGFDHFVIEGAKNSFSMIYALQSEISCLPLYQKMEDYTHSIEFLRDFGFDVTGMFPVNRDQWLRVVEFDFLAINRTHIS